MPLKQKSWAAEAVISRNCYRTLRRPSKWATPCFDAIAADGLACTFGLSQIFGYMDSLWNRGWNQAVPFCKQTHDDCEFIINLAKPFLSLENTSDIKLLCVFRPFQPVIASRCGRRIRMQNCIDTNKYDYHWFHQISSSFLRRSIWTKRQFLRQFSIKIYELIR